MIGECYIGDVRDGLRAMIAAGVRAQTCVTSPPYWGLRDYGTAQWEGGDVACDHSLEQRGGRFASPVSAKQASNTGSGTASSRECPCGATRIDKQLGLEPTIAEYVANMVEVFRLVRDVLADDGTVWLNLGDSYAGAPVGSFNGGGFKDRSAQTGGRDLSGVATSGTANKLLGSGLKPKDLCGIPWRVAFALQADGWYLRQDIIWSKPNPMPESVTDRCTKSHEYIFLLSKRERYYFDAEAIAERSIWATDTRNGSGRLTYDGKRQGDDGTGQEAFVSIEDTRNKRSVWTVTTQPYSEAHFATFPPKLIEPCILAGTSARGHCPACGKGWIRISDRGAEKPASVYTGSDKPESINAIGDHSVGMGQKYQNWLSENPKVTRGWRPSCSCGLDPVSGVVLDPFMGSGTVGQVSQDLGRRWLGCELNPEYVKLQSKRTAQSGLELHA